MFIASLFDAHIRNIRNLNYSIYATFTVSAALELPADLAAIWGLNWLGRRSSAFLFLSLSGICMAICGLCLGEPNLISGLSICLTRASFSDSNHVTIKLVN